MHHLLRQSGKDASKKCPQCGQEMSSGFLQTGNLMAFNKTRHKFSLNPKDEEDVMIAQRCFIATDFNGWICKECGLVTFDYQHLMNHYFQGLPGFVRLKKGK